MVVPEEMSSLGAEVAMVTFARPQSDSGRIGRRRGSAGGWSAIANDWLVGVCWAHRAG